MTADEGGDSELVALVETAATGDRQALDRAFAMLYEQLSAVAHAQRRTWEADATIDTTALVHEAYLKLVPAHGAGGGPGWSGRGHFFALAARVMRQVLLNDAEKRRAMKRGGGQPALSLDHPGVFAADPQFRSADDGVIALDDALARLERINARQARIIECRFFAGMTIEETADALGASPATVKREWNAAREWLRRELSPDR